MSVIANNQIDSHAIKVERVDIILHFILFSILPNN